MERHGPTAILLLPFLIVAAGLSVPGDCQGQAPTPRRLARVDTTLEAGRGGRPEQAGRARTEQVQPLGLRVHDVSDRLWLAWDFASYNQDDAGKQQVESDPDIGLARFRFLFKGKFKTKRPFSWTMGYHVRRPTEDWLSARRDSWSECPRSRATSSSVARRKATRSTSTWSATTSGPSNAARFSTHSSRSWRTASSGSLRRRRRIS